MYLLFSSGIIIPEVKSLEKSNNKVIVHINAKPPNIVTDEEAYWTITIKTTLAYVDLIKTVNLEIKKVSI